MTGELLSFVNYTHNYRLAGFPPVHALSGVTLRDIDRGEIVCIVGSNGSGKSTLFLAILGLIGRTGEEGHISLDGAEIALDDLRVSYIPQKASDGIVYDLSIVENIVLRDLRFRWPRFHRAISEDTRKKVIQLLAELGFEFLISKLGMPPTALSGGEQQVLNTVAAIYPDSDLIISDEPTSKLDEQNRIRVCQLLIHAAHAKGARVLLTTHDIDMAHTIADRIVYLDQGKVTEEQRLRKPLAARNVPAIRLAATIADLDQDVQHVAEEWWKPGKDGLFGPTYMIGDDSVEGYLAGRSLTREERTIREVDAVLRLAGIQDRHDIKIADVPCGWGRHSLELAKRGFSVTGVDLSEEFIGIAREQTKQTELKSVDFQVGDMRQLPLADESFDLVINLWTSFGFFGPEGDTDVLRGFRRILKPGGKVLLHSDLNPLRVRLGIFDEPSQRHLRSGGTLEVKEWFCEEDSYVYGIWCLQEAGLKKPYRIRLYSLEEWKHLAAQSGFEIKSVYGDLDTVDAKLTNRSQEFVLSLQKK